MKTITYSKDAAQALGRMPANIAKRVRSKIRAYPENPQSQANNVRQLQGSPYKRLRVGDWRVIMDDQGKVLLILKVSPRGSAYQP